MKSGNFIVKEFCPRCEKVVTKKVGADCRYCGYPNSWKEEEDRKLPKRKK
jgi:ribosomal protein L37E